MKGKENHTVAYTALITGCSSGIGRATAQLLAAEGWNVAATMRNPDDGADLASHPSTLVTRLDVTDDASIDAAVTAATDRFGGIDVLVNNAGFGAFGPLESTPMETIRRQFDVNLIGVIAVTQAVLPGMRARGFGTIVNVSSIAGRTTFPMGTLYHGSKWALEGLSESLSYELAEIGVRVKLVEPGGVRTDFADRSLVFSNDSGMPEYQPLVERYLASRRAGSATGVQLPDEVAQTILQAITDRSPQLRYLTSETAAALLHRRCTPQAEEDWITEQRRRFGISAAGRDDRGRK